jgi:hypothetical protein
MYDPLHYARPFRALNVINESSRKTLTLEINIPVSASKVVGSLEQLKVIHDLPQAIGLINESEICCAVLWIGVNFETLN